MPVCVFSVRYEYHLHIKKCSYPANMLWRPEYVSPVKYEHHLDIKTQSYTGNRDWRIVNVEDPTLSRQLAHR
jgi:hypothetical protein